MNENFKNSFIGKKIKDIDIDNFGIEITLEDNSKFDYCSKEVFLQKVVKDKIKMKIKEYDLDEKEAVLNMKGNENIDELMIYSEEKRYANWAKKVLEDILEYIFKEEN